MRRAVWMSAVALACTSALGTSASELITLPQPEPALIEEEACPETELLLLEPLSGPEVTFLGGEPGDDCHNACRRTMTLCNFQCWDIPDFNARLACEFTCQADWEICVAACP